MYRTFVLVVACAAAALLSLLAWSGDRESARTERLEWGLYQIHWGRRFEEVLDRELEKFASRPDYVMFYRDLGRPFPKRAVAAIRARGATPIVSLELWRWHATGEGSQLPRIVDGAYDEFFRAWARAAKTEGKRILLRFGFEMNGKWFSWSLQPEPFRKAWKRVHGLFREEGASNVEWVWSPNVVSVPDEAKNAMHLYYPGAEHVDWVALDGYNFGDEHDEWHRWESFASVFEKPLAELEKRYPGKPIMIAETASAPGRGRAQWIREAHAYLQREPRVRALVWFHYDKRREGEPDWRIDTSPGSLRAFNETFASPR